MKDTVNLMNELMETENFDEFLSENEDCFEKNEISKLLTEMLKRKKILKSSLAKKSGMSEVYLHQIFSGRRTPSRNRLICLCFGLSASVDETQKLLVKSGQAGLYAKNKRDAIIINGLKNNIDLFRINDMLFEQDEDTLC